MFDIIATNISTILSLSVGGVSIASIIGMLIYLVKLSINNKKTQKLTKEMVEEAFQNAVLPKNIKLDIANKIEPLVKDGFSKMSTAIEPYLERIAEGEKMMMKILVLFTHFQRLPEETRQEIEDFLNSQSTIEIQL